MGNRDWIQMQEKMGNIGPARLSHASRKNETEYFQFSRQHRQYDANRTFFYYLFLDGGFLSTRDRKIGLLQLLVLLFKRFRLRKTGRKRVKFLDVRKMKDGRIVERFSVEKESD